jgi:Tol biopolymer transport system component
MAAQPAAGAAGDRTLRLISFPGPGAFDTSFPRASDDGSRVWFETREPNSGLGDTDTRLDVYERSADGRLRLISLPGAGAFDAEVEGGSRDGSRVWFRTQEPNPGVGDTDTHFDVYERSADSGLRLVTTPGAGPWPALLCDASADGSRIWFTTDEPNPGLGDTDDNADIYERTADGRLRLISPPGAAPFDANCADASRDGSKVRFRTREPNPALGDSDTGFDVYERSADGRVRLISPVSASSTDTFDAEGGGASQDGSRVWFMTNQPQPGLGDTDAVTDVYERSADGGLRLISLPTSGAFEAGIRDASLDGSRVWFFTAEPYPALGDTDAHRDVYERSADGALRLITTPGSAAFHADFNGHSDDGSRVWFETDEPDPGLGDTDAVTDIYERAADGHLRLITPAGAGAFGAAFQGAAPDGSRVWFTTREPNPQLGDSDTGIDLYERSATGELRLISPPNGGADAFFAGTSQDGSRVRYVTDEPDPALDDVDAGFDVYELRWAAPAGLAAPVASGTGEVGRTLSCAPGRWAGEELSLSTRWLRDGVAIPGAASDTYRLTRVDAGRAVACRVTAVNVVGATDATSNAIGVAGPPRLRRRVTVVGPSIVGMRLRCDRTGIRGATRVATTWRRGDRRVATGPRYRVRRADLGRRIRCRVVATNPAGSLTSLSPPRLVPVRCRVPALRGARLERARALAGVAGCRVRVVRRAGTGVRSGRVLATAPPAGTSGPNGATVTLVVRR